uniref:putative bifunctional diguanylate cyclase/phosphodiesterase n=1 Tax=Sedimenticola selenatireducens TaxID=191960 RepID=UPI003F4ACFA3
YRDLWHSLTETGHWRGEMWNRRKNGELFPKWQTINSVVDGNGNLTHYVGIFSDITHIKQSQEKLDHLGHHDALTDLPNRLLLNERLDQAIKHAERHDTLLAVIFLDLDNFKHINDSLGHPVGDQLLQEVARKLLLATRQDDTVARIGGDEFVLLLEDIGKPENAGIAAQKLAAVFAEPFQLEQQAIRITASLGICICPQDGKDSATLLRNADSAMYRAKEEGRNTYQFYTEELTRNAFERVSLENNLRQAIEKEQLRLLYQPQFELQSGRIIGLEALIRWVHPELGTISPARFIPLAEESGLIHPIGEWVLRTACRQGRQWQQQGIDFGRIAVNIAGPQLQRGNLVNEVIAVLDETQLPTDRLELEVTEGFIMQQAGSAITQLQALRELGLTLSIDDFGTGYSSLSYLKQLPIHKLKIDQSFVRDIPDDRNDMAIADAIIAMGKSLGLRVIAEGVETEAQAEFLKQAGCQEGQGYLYSKPITAEAVEALITEQPALSTE